MAHDANQDNRQPSSVFLGDGDSNMLLIKIWATTEVNNMTFVILILLYGISTQAQDLVQPGELVAVSNLCYRGSDHIHGVPTASAGEMTVFSQRPGEHHLCSALSQLKDALTVSDHYTCTLYNAYIMH